MSMHAAIDKVANPAKGACRDAGRRFLEEKKM